MAKCIAYLALVMLAYPAQAQTVAPGPNSAGFEARATVGLTIPLGGKLRSTQSKPRVDFMIEGAQLDRSIRSASNPQLALRNRRNVRRATLSWTLEDKPRMLLNGRMIASSYRLNADDDSDTKEGEDGEKKGRSTGKKILRGAAVAGGVMVILVGGFLAAVLIECGSDEGCGE